MSSSSPERPDMINTPEAIAAEHDLLRSIQYWDSLDFERHGIYEKAKKIVLDEHQQTTDVFEADNPVYTGLFRPKFEDGQGMPAYLCAVRMPARSAPSNAEIRVPAVQFVTYEMPTDGLSDTKVQIIQGAAVRLLDLNSHGKLVPVHGFTEGDVEMVSEKLASLDFCKQPDKTSHGWGLKDTILPILPHLGPNRAAIHKEPSNA